MSLAHLSIDLPEELARQLPDDPGEQQQVLVLGLREWKIQQALNAYEQGRGSLAFAAQRAGVSLREMVPAAYARGLTPHIEGVDSLLSLERAALL